MRACSTTRPGSNPVPPPACSDCSTAMARKRAWSAARCATRCWGFRSAISISRPPRCPTEVIRRAKAAGIKSVPTGIEHGTVTLVVDAQPFEVTTLREDIETFGRKAKVAFGRDWVRDARAARLHHQRPVGRCRRRRARSRRRLDDIAAQARALHRRSRPAHRRGLSAHPAVLPHSRRLWRGRARSRRISRLHCRARRPCDAVRRTRAHGNAEADGRGRRGRRAGGDGGWRIAAADFRRRRLYRAVRRHGRGGARAWT